MKIIEIDIILPYCEMLYVVGKPIYLGCSRNATTVQSYDNETVEKIEETDKSYCICTDKGKNIFISKQQLGIHVVMEEERDNEM